MQSNDINPSQVGKTAMLMKMQGLDPKGTTIKPTVGYNNPTVKFKFAPSQMYLARTNLVGISNGCSGTFQEMLR